MSVRTPVKVILDTKVSPIVDFVDWAMHTMEQLEYDYHHDRIPWDEYIFCWQYLRQAIRTRTMQ